MRTVWSTIRNAMTPATGVACRCCTEPIPNDDAFGISEHVCGPCRTDGSARPSLRL